MYFLNANKKQFKQKNNKNNNAMFKKSRARYCETYFKPELGINQ